MADTRNKISYFLEQVKYWLPAILQDERLKQRQKQELENALRRILAGGEEERTTDLARIEAQRKSDYMNKILDYFKGRTLPELAGPGFMQETSPGILPPEVVLPANAKEKEADANAALMQFVKEQEAGVPQSVENVRKIAAYYGPEILQKGTSEAIKVSEAAKERPIKEREAAVKEKGIPLREREVAVSEGELKARWKELAGQIGDMTAKEARQTLFKLEVERRGYREKLSKKTDLLGEPLSEDQLRGLKSNIAEIKRLEDKIDSKYGKAMETEYKALADEVKAMGGTIEMLDTNEQLRSDLIERGYNIEKLRKYMK